MTKQVTITIGEDVLRTIMTATACQMIQTVRALNGLPKEVRDQDVLFQELVQAIDVLTKERKAIEANRNCLSV